MAKRPTIGRKFTIGEAIRSRTVTLVAARDRRRIFEETTFQTAVTERDLSLTDQLAYREEQLTREKKAPSRDQKYIVDLKKDVADLKKAMSSERLRESYMQSYNAWLSGSQPVEFHIANIKKEMNSTNDPTLRGELRTALSNAIKDQKRVDDALISNYVTYAAADKTIPVLDIALTKVSKAKARAIASGDQERVSLLNIKEQTLRQARASAVITRKSHKIDLARTRTRHPVRTLDALEDAVSDAEGSANVTINGVRYASEREYWELRRGNYIANGDFAKDYKDYYGTWTSNAVSMRPELLADVAGQVRDSTSLMVTRPELRDQSEYILGLQNEVLGKAVNDAANEILNQARIDYDFIGAAGRLDVLGQATGIDVTPLQNRIIGDIAALKAPVVGELLSVAEALVGRGMSFEAAIKEARRKFEKEEFFARAVSPEELAEEEPGAILEKPSELPAAPPTPEAPPPPPTPEVPEVPEEPAPPIEEKKKEEVPTQPVTAPAVGVGAEFPTPPKEEKEEEINV